MNSENSSKRIAGEPRTAAWARLVERPWPAPLVTAALALVAALVAGAQFALLLVFLNPDLPLRVGGLVAATWRFGLLLSPVALAAFALGSWRRNVRASRLLPWALTVVLAAAALGDWVNASHHAFYLPPGINAQLLKGALWLSLGAVLAFYTALLHTVHHRAYGARSRWLLTLVVVGSLFALVDRRVSYHPPPPPTPAAARPVPGPAPRLLFVGLDGASLDVLLPLARQGRLPFFAGLLEQGSYARLATLSPVRPLALWASAATGKMPHRHGLLGEAHAAPRWLAPAGELKLLPLGLGPRLGRVLFGPALPAGEPPRSALTVWEILGKLRPSAATIGFPPALAAAPLGLAPEPEAAAAPTEPFAETLVVAQRLDRPRLAAATARLTGGDPPASCFLLLPGLEGLSLATVGGFEAAEFAGSRGREQRGAAAALTAHYAELDAALAALWERLPPPRVVVVASVYGVAPPQGMRKVLGELLRFRRTAGSLAGAPDGALLMRGDGIRKGEAMPPGRIVDLLPTLLYLSGLPIARDFDGRVLTEAFEPALLQREPLAFLPTYQGLFGD